MKHLLTTGERTIRRERTSAEQFSISMATELERQQIYHHRHEVYARELGQHQLNATRRLSDALDQGNVYLVARLGEVLAGFISISLPTQPSYSIDKYFERARLPFVVDDGLFEVRLLTVLRPHRGRELATLLMYAAFRWVEAHGGTHIVAIGRREILDLYLRAGLKPAGLTARSGAVLYDLLHASVVQIRAGLEDFAGLLSRIEGKTDWQFPFPFQRPASCFHGGAFFTGIGMAFDALERRHEVINADVLDAWFPPAPSVLESLQDHLEWLLRTSPPTGCEGLIETIAQVRGVAPGHILPGGGSSDLIFRAFPRWLTARSHALILDPTYGEYAHVLEKVIGCTVDRLRLDRSEGYQVNLARLEAALADQYDLVVLVNPNSPTGRLIARADLESILAKAPARTRVWVDETYIEYAGVAASLERFATRTENVLVCKSMSKVYALSGARVAYLCAGAHQLEVLRSLTPPWVVNLPAQVAAVRALQAPGYYAARYAETKSLRAHLATAFEAIGWEIVPGVANFLLGHLPESGPSAADLVERCRKEGLYLRDATAMGTNLGRHGIRVAVKDGATNARMLRLIEKAV